MAYGKNRRMGPIKYFKWLGKLIKSNPGVTALCFHSIFGRASEGEGNAYWCTNQNDMVIAADTMLDTDPAKVYFGTTLNNNQAFIEFIYENTLGKTYAEDPDGVDYWVGELASGKSKGEVIATLINAAMDPQYTGSAAQNQFINKVTVRGTELNNSTNMAQDFSSYSRRIKGSILKYVSFDATQKTS